MKRHFVAVLMLLVVSCSMASEHRANQGSGEGFFHFPDDVIHQFYEQHREHLFVRGGKVWVKAFVCPTLVQAQEARERAETGEDFDELIAEYFIPYFADGRKKRYINKQVDLGWVTRKRFWRSDNGTEPLVDLNPGHIVGPYSRPGAQDFAVLTIVDERRPVSSPLNEVSDNVYSLLCDELADRKILEEVVPGRRLWCGTCRAGRNLNGQLWHLAQHYSDRGNKRKAISACLLALREERRSPNLGGPEINQNGLYPEEQFLVEHGMDIMRYYGGGIDRVVRGHRVHLPDWLPSRVARMEDERVVPLLTRLAANRGRWSRSATYALGSIKAKSAVPTLKELLMDRHIRIAELTWGENEAVYAHYYLRRTARDALLWMGIDPGEVKVVVGVVKGDPLPEHHR
ncbi:MAG: hypothetical protein ACYTFW_14885 [Planctomycetota bacterium]|jgi:hypothetical protein